VWKTSLQRTENGHLNYTKRMGNRLEVKVTPNAGRNAIAGWRDDVLQIKIAAAPEKGKANRELIDFLGRVLGVKKSDITIIQGQTGRNKSLEIQGISREDITNKIQRIITK
jgi:uncharacterized protein (TIGR00251 family)